MERILVVEDELVVAMDLQNRLEMMGYEVTGSATSGEQALQLASQTHPNLILMDIRIRGKMDGIEAATKIRDGLNIPVIFLTAFADKSTLNRASTTGSFGYLIKPVDDLALYAAIENALYKYKIEVKLRESEERYAIAIQATNDAIWDWNLITNQVHYSPRWKTLLGIPTERELTSPKDWMDRVLSEDMDLLNQAFNNHLYKSTPFLECEIRMRHQNGAMFWMLCRGLALFDAGGKPYRIAGSLSDISAQKKAFEEEQLRRKEAELLQQAMAEINSSLNLQEVLDHIMYSLEQAIPFECAAISLVENEKIRIAALGGTSRGLMVSEDLQSKQEKLIAQITPSGIPVVRPLTLLEDNAPDKPIQYWMGIALAAHDRLIGFLTIISHPGNTITSDQSRLAQAFASQAAVAIEHASLFEQVRMSRERLQALSKKLVEIQEAERSHIAHEMHDEIGQVLTGLQFILTIGKEGSKKEVIAACNDASKLVAELITRVREISINLHPPMLDDLGLLPSLKSHFERYQLQTGICIHFHHENLDRRFPPEVELSVFRVIQEALTNVARYAMVKEVNVSIIFSNAFLEVQVKDYGKGFNLTVMRESEHSFGIAGIRERTYLVGGSFEINSKPTEGTQITARFPIEARLERRKHDR